MKLLFLALFSTFLYQSCVSSSKKQPTNPVAVFEEKLQEHVKTSDVSMFFVLNPSPCSPCEDEIASLINHKYKVDKTFYILPSDVTTNQKLPSTKIIRFNRKSLSEYGVLNSNGSVFVFNKKQCVFQSSIDVQNIESLISKIEESLR
jgi:hypothetical protein